MDNIKINFPERELQAIYEEDFPFFSMRSDKENELIYNYVDANGDYCFTCMGKTLSGMSFESFDEFKENYLEDEIKVKVSMDIFE